MSSFTEVFEYRVVQPGIGEIVKPLVFYFDDDKSGEFVTLHPGTRFNGATEPKWLSEPKIRKHLGWLVRLTNWDPWDRRILPATAVHDYLVGEFGPRGRVGPNNRMLSWSEAADWFDAALRVTNMQYGNVSPLKRKTMVGAVRLYGRLTGKK